MQPLDRNLFIAPGSNYLQTSEYRHHISELSAGVNINNLQSRHIEETPIPLPSLLEQHRIVQEIERRFSVADEVEKVVEQSLKQSERLRQSILKKAFEGKLAPQDPSDEPADKLLERIKAEKAKLEAEIKVKKASKKQGRLL